MDMVANLVEWYSRASLTQRKQGKTWYGEAHALARSLSKTTKRDLPTVVGVLAALSPRCAWGDNVLGAISILRTGKTPRKSPILSANLTKAKRIIDGEKPLDVLRGSKVLAFYENMLRPKNSRQVTIDIHAARAAYNTTTLTKKQEGYVFRPKGNAELQVAYRKAARKYRLKPHKFQAIIWLTVRDSLRKKNDGQLHLYYTNEEVTL